MVPTSRSRWHWTTLSSCAASSWASRLFGRFSFARQWEKTRGSPGSDVSWSHQGERLRTEVSRMECDSSRTASVEPNVSTTSHNPDARSSLKNRRQSAYMPPLGCQDMGRLKRPTLLVTGERSPAMFLLATAELERCLEGESQVMVPEAGHGMHNDNPTFYKQTVMAFLQRR